MDVEPNTLPKPSGRKRRHVTTKASKGFRKDFDQLPSILLNCPPLTQKCMLFKAMISDWWLVSHPDMKTLDSAMWLMGFYDCLKEEDLYMTNREYLVELVVWHREKENIK
jgi:hypothetical protein